MIVIKYLTVFGMLIVILQPTFQTDPNPDGCIVVDLGTDEVVTLPRKWLKIFWQLVEETNGGAGQCSAPKNETNVTIAEVISEELNDVTLAVSDANDTNSAPVPQDDKITPDSEDVIGTTSELLKSSRLSLEEAARNSSLFGVQEEEISESQRIQSPVPKQEQSPSKSKPFARPPSVEPLSSRLRFLSQPRRPPPPSPSSTLSPSPQTPSPCPETTYPSSPTTIPSPPSPSPSQPQLICYCFAPQGPVSCPWNQPYPDFKVFNEQR